MASPCNNKDSPGSGGPSFPLTLSLAEARLIALRAQRLADDPAPFGSGKAAVLAAIQHLGYVQVDPISVIQRAHHHVLWSRVPDYKLAMLHELQSPDASVFEYWNHATSYLPMRDYRFSLPLMRRYRTALHWSDQSPEILASIKRMLALIRKKGALMISDVESTAKVRAWSQTTFGKIERRALHELWMRGDIMIRSRKGFEKVFDITESVLPQNTDKSLPTDKQAAEFHIRRSLRALGIARTQELHYLQEAENAGSLREALLNLIERGEVLEARVEEFPKVPVFLFREALEQAKPLTKTLLRFLSPFDNLTIQRKRLKWLFDFDYSVEIYVPPAKRKYGYFALPIFLGDRLIGRLDPKAFRKERKLVINNLVFAPSFTEADVVKQPFVEAMEEFTRFQQCDEWEISRVQPKPFRGFLKSNSRDRYRWRS